MHNNQKSMASLIDSSIFILTFVYDIRVISIFILTFVYDIRVIYLNHNGSMQIHHKSKF